MSTTQNMFNPMNSLQLFGLKEYFINFVNLYKNKKLPKIILLSGDKGIGKFTLSFHLVNYILSSNSKFPYNYEKLMINIDSPFYKKILLNIDKFKPEIILISAGFDAHKRDPLANINLESENYNQITKMIIEIANIHSQGRVISFLEGGYDLLALSESIKEHFLGLSEN